MYHFLASPNYWRNDIVKRNLSEEHQIIVGSGETIDTIYCIVDCSSDFPFLGNSPSMYSVHGCMYRQPKGQFTWVYRVVSP